MTIWEAVPDKWYYVMARWPGILTGIIIVLMSGLWLYLLLNIPARELPPKGISRKIYQALPYFSLVGFFLGIWLCYENFFLRCSLWPKIRYIVTERSIFLLDGERKTEIELKDVVDVIVGDIITRGGKEIGTVYIKCNRRDILPRGMNVIISKKHIRVASALYGIEDPRGLASRIEKFIGNKRRNIEIGSPIKE